MSAEKDLGQEIRWNFFDKTELQKRILENYEYGFENSINAGVKFHRIDGTEKT